MKVSIPKYVREAAAVLRESALIGATALIFTSSGHAQGSSQNPPLNLKIDSAQVNRDQTLPRSFAPTIQKVGPSVVQVGVTSKRNLNEDPDMDFFRRFFGNRGFGTIPGPGTQIQRGLGSGVIVSTDGYILTNNHVVENASEIEVTLNDGRHFAGKVIGTDSKTDIALIKINAANLPVVTLADSDGVEVGDVVLAIGNPFGIGQTVTAGIVSAIHRAALGNMDEDFIQTDAAINPGNSGGALVDADGRLIGINTAILSGSGGNQGIGFAVPSNLARWVTDSLVKSGRVDRGFLGVTIQSLTPDLATAFKVQRTNGALVSDVTSGGPADRAGIKSGDVIVNFNDTPIEDSSQLKLRVAETPPGSKVSLVIDRNGEQKSVNLTVDKLPEENVAREQSPNTGTKHESLAGVGVTDLDQNLRAEIKAPQSLRGAIVTEVSPDSAAYTAGLRAGDVILEINHKPINNAQDAIAATQNPSSSQTLVKVWSNGGTHFLTVDESGQQ
jgi:serine protease Do